MSIPASQICLLRATFHTCRPRASISFGTRLESGSSKGSAVAYRRKHQSTEATAPPTTSHSQSSRLSSTSSVSPEEVSHFSRLASSWWDPHGPSRLLHLMNPSRHDFITSCLNSDPAHDPTAKKEYLDIGCGGGIFASSAARKPHTSSVTAIDPTPEVIAVAQAQQRSDPALAEPKLKYLNCAIEDLSAAQHEPPQQENPSPSQSSSSSTSSPPQSSPQKQYDIITLFEVLEHITIPSIFLTTALHHLKPQGWLIGSTISRHPISYLTTKLIAEAPVVGVVPRGTHDWNKYIRPEELRGWFEKGQKDPETNTPRFGPVRIQGVVYVPFLGWRFVDGSENVGNYFFGVQKLG